MYTHKLYSLLTENPSLASILCPQTPGQTSRTAWRTPTYLQWTTIGPARAGFNALTFFRNFSIPIGVKGTPKSGQLVKWSCVTSLSALQPSWSCREYMGSEFDFHSPLRDVETNSQDYLWLAFLQHLDPDLTAYIPYKHPLPHILITHLGREKERSQNSVREERDSQFMVTIDQISSPFSVIKSSRLSF